MGILQLRLAALALIFGGGLAWSQPVVPRILSRPLPSPQDMAALEARVLQNPDDLEAQTELLRVYADTAPLPGYDDAARRSVRLQHILYLVDRHPEKPASAAQVAYVYRSNGPYANAADHDAVRARWLAAPQAHPGVNAVILNAAKFLDVEDKDDAENLLRSSLDADPDNRELAANLGFLFAREILGVDLAAHATSELQRIDNAVVLAGAGTALPNLAVKASGGRIADPKIFELASELSARARKLAPGDPDIQGPMPLIKYFAATQEASAAPPPAPNGPARIRVGETVQAANLIRRTEPAYPEEARRAGISGRVQFSGVIARDGTVQNLQVLSGHPLLVPPALDAVKTWVYRPTLLNGAPVEVLTTMTVSFPAN